MSSQESKISTDFHDSEMDETSDLDSELSQHETVDQEKKFIVFESCLNDLIKFCPKCGSPVTESKKIIKWVTIKNNNIMS
jgi:hypothetical protein